MTPKQKLRHWALRSFRVAEHICVPGGWYPWFQGRGHKASFGDFPNPAYVSLFIWLLLYSKTAISIVLSRVLWIILVRQWTEGIMGTLEFIASWAEVLVDWGLPQVWLASEVRTGFLELALLWHLWRLLLTPGGHHQNCISGYQLVSEQIPIFIPFPKGWQRLYSASQPLKFLSWTHLMPTGARRCQTLSLPLSVFFFWILTHSVFIVLFRSSVLQLDAFPILSRFCNFSVWPV